MDKNLDIYVKAYILIYFSGTFLLGLPLMSAPQLRSSHWVSYSTTMEVK